MTIEPYAAAEVSAEAATLRPCCVAVRRPATAASSARGWPGGLKGRGSLR